MSCGRNSQRLASRAFHNTTFTFELEYHILLKLLSITVATVCFLANSAVIAQLSNPSTTGLMVNASESVALAPEGIRLVMRIQVTGKDAKSAIKAINEQKETVRKELVGMNAQADSIRFSATDLSSGMSGGMNARMYRSMGAIGGDDEDESKEDTMPKMFGASCWASAKWALPAKEGDAIAMLPAMLKQQIAARDLEGKKRKPDLEPEQLEQYEQMMKMMQQQMSYGGEDSQATKIEFFASVSKDVSKTAFNKAFEKAKVKAQNLGDAAGIKLGKINMITSQSDDSMQEVMYGAWRGSQMPGPEAWLQDSEDVEYSTSLDALKYTVGIWISYNIE